MTRMWLADPEIMCRQHLVGEHAELHQLVGTITNHPHGEAILNGHAKQGNIDTSLIESRHSALVDELRRRGHDHDSPLPAFADPDVGSIDIASTRTDLAERCSDCREKMEMTA